MRDLDAPVVGEEFRADWEALQRLAVEDPTSPQIPVHADRLLHADAPLGVRLGAWLAKARQAYAVGDDAGAVIAADQGFAAFGPGQETPNVVVDLAIVRVRALVRGGDPARAVAELESPRIRDEAGLHASELSGLLAVALDRNAESTRAFVAMATWREQVPEDSASAAYVESRLRALQASFDPAELQKAAAAMPRSAARQCVLLGLGQLDEAWLSPWLGACGTASTELGVLLPRSGPLSALADGQLAAVSIALPLLLPEPSAMVVRWHDSGSTPAEAKDAARRLIQAGVRTVIGPVGAENVHAVAEQMGSRVRLIVPGESVPGAQGVAPSLETRVAQLVERARRQGASRFVVAAPANGYGRRAVEAVRGRLSGAAAKGLLVQTYDPSTTSFSPMLAPILPALTRNAALIVPDHISRVELIVRQLARLGQPPRTDASEAGVLVFSTAEGLSEASLAQGHEVLDGLWVAPAASWIGEAADFARAFRERQGEPPSDQALLVFFALRRALQETPGEGAKALRIAGGQLVSERSSQATPSPH